MLNVEANVEIDITALDAVEELRAELVGRGVVFALARVKQDLLSPLRAYGLADRIGPDRLFPTLPTAETAYQDWERTHPPDPQRLSGPSLPQRTETSKAAWPWTRRPVRT